MDRRLITPERLAASVIAVPPLARDASERIVLGENAKLIRHLEAGGIRTLLYGGNANLYHVRLSEYATLLRQLVELAGAETLVVPSAGPAYGLMMDQAEVLKDFSFPAVMVLPHVGLNTPAGVETGLRRFAAKIDRPIVVYLKQEGYVTPGEIARMVDDGLVAWVKYAIVRPDPADDSFLKRLVDVISPSRVVSGIGEQPALVHMRDFKLVSFTSGCVCIAPALSEQLRAALLAGDWPTAQKIQAIFKPLEDLRNAINPVRVLHEAVSLCGLADMGPIPPLLSPLTADEQRQVGQVAGDLKSSAARSKIATTITRPKPAVARAGRAPSAG